MSRCFNPLSNGEKPGRDEAAGAAGAGVSIPSQTGKSPDPGQDGPGGVAVSIPSQTGKSPDSAMHWLANGEVSIPSQTGKSPDP